MYVAVKGGEAAITNAHRLLADRRRGDRSVPALTLAQIAGQLSLAVDRVMAEGSLYDPELAALAIKQARGDLIEAVFLLRAYRTTLPRFGHSEPVDTGNMLVERRVSAIYKDLPGGQVLGPTFDYTHRLLDPDLAGDEAIDDPETGPDTGEKIVRCLGYSGRRGADRRRPRGRQRGHVRTSPAPDRNIRWGATRGCRPWRAATKASCLRSPIRPSAAMRAAILSPARSALAKSMSR
jgi:alpha-D-ribose 1-methylphosphonate 5-triphosphate synthase subunit PhnI